MTDATPAGAGRKVALITGGARRVGRAVAVYLAGRGYDVLVTYRNSEGEARALAAEIGESPNGGRCELVRADLSADEAVDRIAAGHAGAFDRLDLLVHNASDFTAATLEETTPELIRTLFKVHVETPLLLTRRLTPLLKASGGSVVSMSDLAADRPFKSHLAYSASKAALQNLTLGLAKALAPEARANAIAPGAVEWPDDMSEAAREEYLRKVPLRRAGTPQDVARAVWFLAEEAPYMTGQVLRLDGGRSGV